MNPPTDRTQPFGRSINALGRVTAGPAAVAATVTVAPPHHDTPPDDHGQSLGAELRSSIILLLAFLAPILVVALVAH